MNRVDTTVISSPLLRILLTAIISLSLAGSSLARLERLDPAVADSIAASTDDVLIAADALSDSWQHEKALKLLESAATDNAEILWRIGRSKINIAENLDGKEGVPLYESAITDLEKALTLDPKNAKAHEQMAIAAGRMALYKGIFKASGYVKRVHRHALQAVALGDSMPVALFVLGRLHKKLMEKSALKRRLGGLSFARDDSVAWYFEKSIKVSHGNMVQCYEEYGDFLIDHGNVVEGRKMLEKALALPLRDEHDLEGKKEAQMLLSEHP